jgi:hypothetical protein
MSGRNLAALLMAVFVPVTLLAQAKPAPSRAAKWEPPRTAWGDPDLQGIWNNVTATPLQRSNELKDKALLTKEEAEALAQRNAQREAESEARPTAEQTPGQRTGYASSIWFETTHSLSQNRTSLLVTPDDGRLPPLTPEGQKIAQELGQAAKLRPADDPEDRGAYERCISRGLPGAMMPGFYNHNYQIIQTRGYVVISVEMIHDARIIPLDGRPAVRAGLNQWLGSSRGRFEGNSLVVETTGFKRIDQRNVAVFGTSERGRVIERFTPIGPDVMDYEITIDDPVTYTKTWTASIPMSKVEGPLYEYACHEGNYGLKNILTGHRKEEEEKAAAPQTAAPQR